MMVGLPSSIAAWPEATSESGLMKMADCHIEELNGRNVSRICPQTPDQRRRDDGADDALPAAASCDQRCERHQHQHRIIGKDQYDGAADPEHRFRVLVACKQQEREREGQ